MSILAPSAIQLSAALLSQGFTLRPETEDDTSFLGQLYASTREDELALVDWSAEQKQAFLAGQFQAQRHHYRTYLAGCSFDILEYNGVPIGRLYLDVRPSRLHIADIALMPEWRGKGIGTAILEMLIGMGSSMGKSVGIFVEKFNPALRLYRRLGFIEIQDTGVYLEMEWTADGPAQVAVS
ncbi:MAG: GNAT family N-acetyltransferase [Rhizomicrobium sp.]|jgi:ribosomal protein S18 acetylase RimI-like enzyme